MIRGLYTSISGLAAAEARQRVLAFNLGNLTTPGFKGDDVTTESFEQIYGSLFDPAVPGAGAQSTVDRAGGRRLDLTQGGLTETGSPLDLALDGSGFFVLEGAAGPLYTRTGRFSRDATGLLRSADGLAVQGIDGRPITAAGAEVRVLADGAVLSDGAIAGRLQLVELDAASMTRAGAATFTSTDTPTPARARVVSGALENSNVDATAVMTSLTLLLRAFEAGRQAVQLQNDTLGQTVTQVGSLR